MSALFGPEFQGLLAAALRRVRLLRGRRDSELRARRRVGAPRGAFAGHRPYSPGDDVRDVDWNAFARSKELYAKLFEEDEHRAVTLLLDSTPSMAAGTRFDGARRFAALLGALALGHLDGVRVVLGPEHVQTFDGAGSLQALLRMLKDAPYHDADPLAFAQVPIERGWLGSTCWISDFAVPESYAHALRQLRASGRRTTGVLPTLESDRIPAVGGLVELHDPETGAHEVVRIDAELRRAMQDELESLRRRQEAVFASAGIRLHPVAIPAEGDYRLESWVSERWISRI